MNKMDAEAVVKYVDDLHSYIGYLTETCNFNGIQPLELIDYLLESTK
jgi:hypothetical protein